MRVYGDLEVTIRNLPYQFFFKYLCGHFVEETGGGSREELQAEWLPSEPRSELWTFITHKMCIIPCRKQYIFPSFSKARLLMIAYGDHLTLKWVPESFTPVINWLFTSINYRVHERLELFFCSPYMP
jgi:hypothetical protein